MKQIFNSLIHFATGLVVLLFFFYCQKKPASEYVEPIFAADSTITMNINAAWSSIRDAEYDSLVQSQSAKKMYALYLGNPSSEAAEKAVAYAFMMWGNIGETVVLEEAVTKVDRNSDIWHDFIAFIPNAYGRHDFRNVEQAFLLLDYLKDELTHPMSKSQALYYLLDYYQFRDEQKFLDACNELIDLEADSYFVSAGKKQLNAYENLNIGDPAPDFSEPLLSGELFTLSDNTGKYLFLDFWATWCGPCLADLPELKQINEDFTSKNFQIVGISLDEQLEDLTSYLNKQPIPWPQIYQKKTWNDTITTSYSILSIPSNFLIDPYGNIIAKDLSMEELREKLEEIMPDIFNSN